jgi:hypothetical protein
MNPTPASWRGLRMTPWLAVRPHWETQVNHLTFNPVVVGSIPTGLTNDFKGLATNYLLAGFAVHALCTLPMGFRHPLAHAIAAHAPALVQHTDAIG